MAFVIAILPAVIFAYPFGFCVYVAAFFFGGGPMEQASQFSKMFAEALCAPVFFSSLLFPNPGGELGLTLLAFGFPYAWFFFTIVLSLLGFSRWNRKIVKELEGQFIKTGNDELTDKPLSERNE
jgi:hypothetical protein